MRNPIQNPLNVNTYAHYIASIPNPGVGLPADFNCPVNSRIRVNHIQFILTTANANHHPVILILPPAAWTTIIAAPDTCVNALTTTACMVSTGITSTWYSTANSRLHFPLPEIVLLDPGDIFRIACLGMNAADVLSNILIGYDQWIIP